VVSPKLQWAESSAPGGGPKWVRLASRAAVVGVPPESLGLQDIMVPANVV
jgi:hypothetical protein